MVFSEIENASGDSKFDCIADLMPDKDNLRVRVRILRLWKVPAFLNPLESSSMEMVLVDDKVKFIVDNFLLMCVMYVKKQLIYMFESKIEEGQVYDMSSSLSILRVVHIVPLFIRIKLCFNRRRRLSFLKAL
jgi:hypothetical protein